MKCGRTVCTLNPFTSTNIADAEENANLFFAYDTFSASSELHLYFFPYARPGYEFKLSKYKAFDFSFSFEFISIRCGGIKGRLNKIDTKK